MNLRPSAQNDRCDAVRCRQEYEVRYVRGATSLNRRRRVQLCAKHLKDWYKELDSRESEIPAYQEPAEQDIEEQEPDIKDQIRSAFERIR